MPKRVCFCLAIAALLGSLIVQAADKQIVMKLAGQQLSGSFSAVDPMTGMVINGSFNPGFLPDGGQVVFANWAVCAPQPPPPCGPCTPPPPPPPPPICTDMGAGFAPRSAVTLVAGGDAVVLDFDTTKMLMSTAPYGPSTWKGTFRRYTGLFSQQVETTGENTITNVNPGWPDPNVTWTLTQRTSGRRQESTAIFTGMVGSRIVTSVSPNGRMLVHNGGVMTIQTPAP